MKKIAALLLALAMLACMNVTAFAAGDPTTTLTAKVPENSSYKLHIPKDMTLEYGNTEKQVVGELYVTDVADDIENITCPTKYTDLINTDDPTDTISLELYAWQKGLFPVTDDLLNKEKGNFVGYLSSPNLYNKDWEEDLWTSPFMTYVLKAQVSDWTGATAGATYQAIITYVVNVWR